MNELKHPKATTDDIEKYKEKILKHSVFTSANKLRGFLRLVFKYSPGGVQARTIRKEIYPDSSTPNLISQEKKKINTKLAEYYKDDSDNGGAKDHVRFAVENLVDGKGYFIVDEKKPKIRMGGEFSLTADTHPQVFPRWDRKKLLELWEEIEENTEIKILTTVFIDWDTFKNDLEDAAKKNARLEIVLMDPAPNNFPIINARFRHREPDFQPEVVQAKIKQQIEEMADIRGKLEKERENSNEEKALIQWAVKVSSLMPFGHYVQIGDTILLGLLLPRSSYAKGPMTVANQHSPLGTILKSNWQEYWEDGRAHELFPNPLEESELLGSDRTTPSS